MANYARRGNGLDLEVARELEAAGWLVGSRRHIGGAGDLLAIRPGVRTRLIECKTTAAGRYERFSRRERAAMRELGRIFASELGPLELWLVWKPPGAKAALWIPESDWPSP